LVYRPERTIHKMRVSFHLEYRCIFCLPSRRLMQIIMPELNIIYSFWLLWCRANPSMMFIRELFCVFLFVFYLTTCTWFFFFFGMHIASLFFFYWHDKHSSLFTWIPCGLQLHLPHAHTPLASECSLTLQWQSHKQSLHFVIFRFLNSVEVLISIFSFPFTTIFYIPFGSLYLPIKRDFILHRERWNTPD